MEKFEIRIDATACTSMAEGLAWFRGKQEYDAWCYKNLKFESGKIYGIIGEYEQGPMYLSYLLGGNNVKLEQEIVSLSLMSSN